MVDLCIKNNNNELFFKLSVEELRQLLNDYNINLQNISKENNDKLEKKIS